MSEMGELVGIATGQAWKVATAVLASLLLASCVAGGAAWWTSDHALRQAQADLAAANGRINEYQAAIREQNRATEVLAKAKADADARGAAAMQLAAAAGRRYDGALQQLAGASATSCADAMPYVNKLLEDVK